MISRLLPCDAMQAQPMSLCGVRVSVRPSGTFVHSVKRNKDIFHFFHRQVASPFFVPNVMAIFRREPPSGGLECRCGRQKSRFWANVWLHRVLSTLRPVRCYQHGAARPWQVVTLIAGSKRRSLLMAWDDDEMCVTRSVDVTPKTTEQHLIVCSDKSVARQTRSIAWLLCNSRIRNTHSSLCVIMNFMNVCTRNSIYIHAHAYVIRNSSFISSTIRGE